MKAFWKLLGATLAIGLTPYKVEKNEETGEKSYQALLWRITSAPGENEGHEININLGEGTLTSKLAEVIEKNGEETHLFSDELCVEYTGTPAEEEEEASEEPAPAEEAAAPAEPDASAEPEEPAEEEPAAEEDKEEA